jgi:hypothetical protein
MVTCVTNIRFPAKRGKRNTPLAKYQFHVPDAMPSPQFALAAAHSAQKAARLDLHQRSGRGETIH